MISNANQILPNLWIGNIFSALDKNFLKKNDINVIINVILDQPFINSEDKS